MTERVRFFLGLEVVIFATAALIHFEILVDGYRDQGAGIAESVIAGVLLLGLTASWMSPASTRRAGIAAQGFALTGTLVGLTLLLVVGPRTILDVIIHLVMLVVLIVGLAFTGRAPSTFEPRTDRVVDPRS
jgi:hypothetical protein